MKNCFEKEEEHRMKVQIADKAKIDELTINVETLSEAEHLKKKEYEEKLESLTKSQTETMLKLEIDHEREIDNLKKAHNQEIAQLQHKLSIATKNYRETIASEADYRAKYIRLRSEVKNSPERLVDKTEKGIDTEKIDELTINVETLSEADQVKKREYDENLETLTKSQTETILKLEIDHESEIGKLKTAHCQELANLQKKLSIATQNYRETIASAANYRAMYLGLRDKERNADVVSYRGRCLGRGGKKRKLSWKHEFGGDGDRENNNHDERQDSRFCAYTS